MNEAVCIKALCRVRRHLQIVIEQPQSSVMFQLEVWEDLAQAQAFEMASTFMGCFGHFMLKPTVLLGNMTYMSWLFALRLAAIGFPDFSF